MVLTMTDTYAKPLPLPDEPSQPFFDGLVNDTLMLQHCRTCDAWMWPVTQHCRTCLSGDVEWAASSGRGTLYSFALVHQVYHPGFADEIPYNVVFVDLDEGVRMTSNVVGIANEDLHAGIKLVATFEHVGDGLVIPKFTPAQ